jgi:hypothetical protein
VGQSKRGSKLFGWIGVDVEENYEVSPRGSFWVDRNLRCTTFFFRYRNWNPVEVLRMIKPAHQCGIQCGCKILVIFFA